jgi:hypothetical protein
MLEWGGLDLGFWRDTRFWPHNAVAVIIPGGAGHEQEITLSLHNGDGPLYDFEQFQPDFLVGLITAVMPQGWKIDDRGTRLELHPSGRRYGGFDDFDVAAVERGLRELGFEVEIRDFRRG